MLDIASQIYEAASAPDAWPGALQAVAEVVGAVGAACRILNRRSGETEWVAMSSRYPARATIDYIRHFAAIDPFLPIVTAAPNGRWMRLSECIPTHVLRRDEWYCDFMVKQGVVDTTVSPLFDSGDRLFMLGIQQGVGQKPIQPDDNAALQPLLRPLRQAAQVTIELRRARSAARAATIAAEQLAIGIVLCTPEGRILEINQPAERLIQSGESLTVAEGRIASRRNFETDHLRSLIAAAGGTRSDVAGGRMLLGGNGASLPLIVSVMPLDADRSPSSSPAAMVLISGAGGDWALEEEIAELFGLSRAEARLAAALARGKTLTEWSVERGLKITTLRTQLSSILKKLNLHRQADLVRLLAAIPPSNSPAPSAPERC